ncbi:MAG TPA: hypothetical protein VGD37_28545 [Kofleriaceae bacterium]
MAVDKTNGAGADGAGADGAAASKHAAESLHAFYAMISDPDAMSPHPYDSSLSYLENRLVAGLQWANTGSTPARGRAPRPWPPSPRSRVGDVHAVGSTS